MATKYYIVIAVFLLVITVAIYSSNSTDMQKIDETVRGQRNRNPLNIKQAGKTPWQGSTGLDSQGHAIFISIEYGLRAALIDLRGKIKRGLNSPWLICDIWAEANIVNYANFVAKGMDIQTNTTIVYEKEVMRKLVYYMAIWESKYKLSAEQYDKAWELANSNT